MPKTNTVAFEFLKCYSFGRTTGSTFTKNSSPEGIQWHRNVLGKSAGTYTPYKASSAILIALISLLFTPNSSTIAKHLYDKNQCYFAHWWIIA